MTPNAQPLPSWATGPSRKEVPFHSNWNSYSSGGRYGYLHQYCWCSCSGMKYSQASTTVVAAIALVTAVTLTSECDFLYGAHFTDCSSCLAMIPVIQYQQPRWSSRLLQLGRGGWHEGTLSGTPGPGNSNSGMGLLNAEQALNLKHIPRLMVLRAL